MWWLWNSHFPNMDIPVIIVDCNQIIYNPYNRQKKSTIINFYEPVTFLG